MHQYKYASCKQGCSKYKDKEMDQFEQARKNMIDCQLRTNGVCDAKLLNAFYKTPREHFLPVSLKANAYLDEDIMIDDDVFLMEPMKLGKMLDAARLQQDDFVMVVGDMTGYMAAVLSGIVTTVMLLVDHPDRLKQAQEKIEQLGINNIIYIVADHMEGSADQAPYDVVLMNGFVPEAPAKILEQLSDAGRYIGFENAGDIQKMVLYEKKNQHISNRHIADLQTYAVSGVEQKQEFQF